MSVARIRRALVPALQIDVICDHRICHPPLRSFTRCSKSERFARPLREVLFPVNSISRVPICVTGGRGSENSVFPKSPPCTMRKASSVRSDA